MIRQPDCYTEEPASVLVFVHAPRTQQTDGMPGEGFVLGVRGVDVAELLEDVGPILLYWGWLDALLVERGVWVWEGKTSYPAGPEDPIRARGTLRRPTLSELARVAAGINPFDVGTTSPLCQVPAEYDFSWEDEVT